MSATFHTSLGDIKIEVFCEAVPRAAENFLGLCASGTYNGTGDPSGTGKGGQSIWGAAFDDEIRATLKFNARGIVAMANSAPNTNKSQPHLDGKYTIIGKVIDGAELGGTLEAMEKVANDAKHRPIEPIITNSVTIHANPIAQKALP